MEEKGLIIRRPNPEDGRGVLIFLTDFGKEKRDYSREKVLTFNETIKANVSEENLESFYKVSEIINNMISNKQIYNQKEHILK
jgi:DNA-binding MarR family transcriptional regulator